MSQKVFQKVCVTGLTLSGAGQISMAISRRVGFGKKIVLGDKSMKNCETIAKIMNDAGYDVEPLEMDLSDRASIKSMITKAQEYGEIKYMVNGAGVTISSQSGWRMQQLRRWSK